MSVSIIGGADGPTAVFLSRPSPMTVMGCVAAAVILILLAAFVFNKCLKAGEKQRKIFVFSALALNDVYLFIKFTIIFMTLYSMFLAEWNGSVQGAELDALNRIYEMNIFIGGGFAVVHNLLIIGIFIFAFYKRMNKTFKNVTAVIFYIIAAVIFAADVICGLVNLGTPEMSVTAVLAALMIMVMAMFAKIRKEG
ncbi:MAG: hypothetical protein IJR45_01485 [Firmicutes bacterium]|nr:hypothetical protein [Bacillota bacterium]MBQ9604065.1 hypothetical protein [Bacillota bacterium]